MYKITLRNCGNPDHGQDPSQPIFGTESGMVVYSEKIEELQEAARKYIEDNNLGSGSFLDPDVYLDGVVVGDISYNGRYWPKK